MGGRRVTPVSHALIMLLIPTPNPLSHIASLLSSSPSMLCVPVELFPLIVLDLFLSLSDLASPLQNLTAADGAVCVGSGLLATPSLVPKAEQRRGCCRALSVSAVPTAALPL